MQFRVLGAVEFRTVCSGTPYPSALWLGQVIAEDDPVRAQLLVERATAIARRAGFTLPVVAS